MIPALPSSPVPQKQRPSSPPPSYSRSQKQAVKPKGKEQKKSRKEEPDEEEDEEEPHNPPRSSSSPHELPRILVDIMELKRKFPTASNSRIRWALERTSADIELMEKVLVADMRGEPLPDLPGIWTEDEDEVLVESTKAIEEIGKRKEDWARRVVFLEAWKKTESQPAKLDKGKGKARYTF